MDNQSILNSWIPVFTGMTGNETCPEIVTPAKAGVQCGIPNRWVPYIIDVWTIMDPLVSN